MTEEMTVDIQTLRALAEEIRNHDLEPQTAGQWDIENAIIALAEDGRLDASYLEGALLDGVIRDFIAYYQED